MEPLSRFWPLLFRLFINLLTDLDSRCLENLFWFYPFPQIFVKLEEYCFYCRRLTLFTIRHVLLCFLPVIFVAFILFICRYKATMIEDVPRIFEAVFQCTLQVRNKAAFSNEVVTISCSIS